MRAWQQEAAPTAEAEEIAELAQDVPSIRPLAPALPIVRIADAAARRTTDPRTNSQFLISVVAAESEASAMVGVLDGETMAPLRTVSLRKLPPDGWLIDLPVGAKPHRLVLAPTAPELRYAYIASTWLPLESTGKPTPVRLDATTSQVTVALGWFESTPRPLIRLGLERIDDPDWLPPAGCLTQTASTRPTWTLSELGAGTYRLTLSGASVAEDQVDRLQFTLPGPDSARSIAITLKPGR